MPRERVCFLYVICTLWWRRNHVSGWCGSAALRIAGNSRRADFDRLRHWPALNSFWRRNPRAGPAGVEVCKGKENMAEVETKVFPIEALREFSTRMFLYFG